ncbi:MAG: hypothetical protein KIS78_10045 [Labilithrix sp.]|nr:hypothetical protein [Labilithrix sp.]MCW5832739.1 hypothetical protein [Labilithrix sp.]
MVIQGAGHLRRVVAGAILTLGASLTSLAGCGSCGESKPRPEPDPPAAASGERPVHVSWDAGRRRPLRRRGPLPPYLAGEDAGGLLVPAQPHAPPP